ncbi:unnamed protein product, partial [Medioppia subpectinata]
MSVVLCAVELSQAAAPTTNTLKVTDKNHLKKADRETQFICEYTTSETVTKVGIYQVGVGLPILEVTAAGTIFNKFDGKINSATYDVTNKDFHKATFSIKKADAPVLEEIATFAVAVKDPVDTDKPNEFKSGGQLDGTCAYDIPVGETLIKLEILSGDRVIAAGDKYFKFTYPKPEGFSDVRAQFDREKSRATFTVNKLTDKSAGEFRCRYTVEDGSTPKITKVIVSNGIVLIYINDTPIVTDVMLTIEDKNHLNKDNRETVFVGTFTKIKDAANIVVNVVKIDEKPAFTLFTVDAKGSMLNKLSDKIMLAEFDPNNKDGQKTTFTLKKAGAPAPGGVYRCDVDAPGTITVSSKTIKVYTNSELISFDVGVYGADRDHNIVVEMHGSCAYDIPVGETLKQLEVSSGDRDFISGVYADDIFTF